MSRKRDLSHPAMAPGIRTGKLGGSGADGPALIDLEVGEKG